KKLNVVAPAGTVGLDGPAIGVPLPDVTTAPVALVNCTAWSWLVGVLALVWAVIVAISRPLPTFTTVTPTLGRTEHENWPASPLRLNEPMPTWAKSLPMLVGGWNALVLR